MQMVISTKLADIHKNFYNRHSSAV